MESLISAILDAVFDSLVESGGVSDWLCDQLKRDPEKLAFKAALTQALTDAGQYFPGRDLRYFAEMVRDFGGPLIARTLQPASALPTAAELTTAWLNHLNLDSVVYYKVDFERFGTIFLNSLQQNLENQQPLQWIVQLRTQKITADAALRMADATEQQTTHLAELVAHVERLIAQMNLSQVNTAGGAMVTGNVQTGRDFVGRDRITIRNYFMTGLTRLPFDYGVRIDEFLLEYLGPRHKRVPFGGRATQLAELDTWLDDRNAPPYYLMTAEAGRGKSALVCRWQTQVLTRGDVEVIFLPISIRFETATQDVVFAALAARLAAIHGEEMQATTLSADQWRATCQNYLRREPPEGKQLLVILDGLDEATGWTPGRGLFPGDPPNGLRLVATARQHAGVAGPQGWAAVLGWNDDRLAKKTTLLGLNHAGMQEALVSMGNPLDRLATQVDVIGELYRLTEGDPLLVRLYVDALVGKGKAAAYLSAEELATIQPGLQGYFDSWWREQHEQWRIERRDPFMEYEGLRQFLNVIAAALGPVTQDDLAAVCEVKDWQQLRRFTEIIGRWLTGDGNMRGYTFSHPRLGYYFWEQLSKAERLAWDDRFANWGATVLADLDKGELVPPAAPRYLIQHFAAHLTRSGAPAERFYALLSDSWRQAWEKIDVTNSGFLNDISAVEAQARAAYNSPQPGKVEALVQQVKAALCRSSIKALGSNIAPELLRLALTNGLRTPTQALAITQLMAKGSQCASALAALLPHLPCELFRETVMIARSISDEAARAKALAVLAPHLPEALLAEALTAAKRIGNAYARATALTGLAPHLSLIEQSTVLAEALAAAKGISDEYARANALAGLAPYLSPDLLADALVAAREMGIAYARTNALAGLAPYLSPDLRTEALATARGMGNKANRTRALEALARSLPPGEQATVLAEALSAARGIGNNANRAVALGRLASYLSAGKQATVLAEALSAARSTGDESDRARALIELTPYLSPDLLAGAVAAARRIGNEADRARALIGLAPHLPPALLADVVAAARRIDNTSARATALTGLAPHLSPDLQTEALTAVRRIRNEADRAKALAVLASHLPEALLAEALTAAKRIGKPSARAIALTGLAPRLSLREQSTVLAEAVASARGIGDEYARARILADLAPLHIIRSAD